MKSNNKKVIEKRSFPDYLAPDEEKNQEAYGLEMAKAIEYEWWYRPENKSCTFYDKRDKYHNLRLYARGEQDTKLYKDLITGGDATSFSNYDWRPLQIIPKFVKLISNQMSERLFDIKAEAVDKYSTNLKDQYKRNLEDLMIAKPLMKIAKDSMGVDIMPDNINEVPDTQEEIDLHMGLKYKPAIEIAAEEAIKYTLELNDYEETQSRVIEDITTLGIGAIKHRTDVNKGIVVEYVDPADSVYSFPKNRNFSDVHYFGEAKRVTINELKRMSGDKFSNEELKDIALASSKWNNYHSNNSNSSFKNGDLDNIMVDLLFFTFKSTNTISYKKKSQSNGGYKMTKKSSTFSKRKVDYGFDVAKKIIDVWYEGVLILGTEKIFDYKLCENMIRPQGYLNRTMPSYIFYAPEIYQNRTQSTVGRIIPYVDQMQQIHIKLQQLIAKARPNGVFIDVEGLDEIPMGDGSFLSPLEVIKIYNETGNVIGSSKTAEGEYNYGKEPVRELKNGIVDGLDRLIGAYNHYLGLLRDAIGIPQGADASMPHPDTLVGVQQQVALNSNTATRHILDSALNISETLGKGLSLRLKDIFEYSDLKKAYINAIGSANVEVLKSLNRYHLHDIGINIELKPDAQEKQYLEANIQASIAKDSITLDDASEIRNISNSKLANALLRVRRNRREQEKREHEQSMIKANADAQAMAAERATQAKIMEIQAKTQADMAIVQANTEATIMKIKAEKEAKSELMQQEFNYNLQIKGAELDIRNQETKYKEDRKDGRQDKNNSQASKLIEQRDFKTPSLNFESSEDNISGSIEMGELEPS